MGMKLGRCSSIGHSRSEWADESFENVTVGLSEIPFPPLEEAVGGATAGVAHGVAQVRSARASGMCTTNSFTAGTAVMMADGSSKPIEDVEVGDEVLATDPSTGQSAAEPVSGVIVGHGQKDLATVTVSDGSRAGLGTAQVTATAGHPFWVTGTSGDSGDPGTGTVGEGRWVSADHLKAGDHLATAAPRDGPATIDTIREVTRTTTVYNLTVDGLHTYYVLAGNTSVLVHNACGEFPWSSGRVSSASRSLDQGATSATVRSRSEAEELFLGKYQGQGYRNASGFDGVGTKQYFGEKRGTYHWDDELGPDGRVVGHGAGNADGDLPHLQIHTYDGPIIRIFWGVQ